MLLARRTHTRHRHPHVDEYDGDGYDDYARTLQGAWEDDSPFHRDYEYNEKEFKNHFAFSVSGNQHSTEPARARAFPDLSVS
jgi:hypothetical protein